MLAVAREAVPSVPFHLVDATVDEPALGTFDAVFSNAALHWMQPQERALRYARACLAPGGRFVAEMGGHGNVAKATAALMGALESLGLGDIPVVRNWFPSIPVQSALLEGAGFEVVSMLLFDRPTPLAPGLTVADWTQEFRADTWAAVPRDVWPDLANAIDERAAPVLLTPEGWRVDYRRLRFVAIAR
jgi:SAM-dependent methyltransferase